MWTEITTLVIPGYNFDEAWVRSASAWIRKEIGPDTPLHFSAFFPNNRLRNAQPTPIGSLLRCREIAMEEGLRWVYIGNVPIGDYESSKCPECGEMLIGRDGYRVLSFREKCKKCGRKIPVAGRKWLR